MRLLMKRGESARSPELLPPLHANGGASGAEQSGGEGNGAESSTAIVRVIKSVPGGASASASAASASAASLSSARPHSRAVERAVELDFTAQDQRAIHAPDSLKSVNALIEYLVAPLKHDM